MTLMKKVLIVAALTVALAPLAFGQVTPAGGYTPPDDTPKINVGTTIYADYTYQESPKISDADKNSVNLSSFNISRAYLNVTGNLNHLIAFRVTPDVTRESGTGSSLAGSLTFRLKYAFGQLNLDDWTNHGSWVRFGIQQTPYVDYTEGIYRYRWQGTIFSEREGFMSSSDAGLSGRWTLPGNYGDVHAGFYNGENYNRAETNNQKSFQLRGSLRPLPLGGVLKGLRLTGFHNQDKPINNGKRERNMGQITFEHPLINAGLEFLDAKDRSSVTTAQVHATGHSIWATPRFGTSGWELLLRRDDLKPDKNSSAKRTRNIIGLAYWIPNLQKVTSAVMLDYDSLKRSGVTPSVPNTTNYGIKMLINF
jgi:hypothetical protein